MSDLTNCPLCKAEFKTSLGYIRCPECNQPLDDKNKKDSSLAWTLPGVLKRYEGQMIGINYNRPGTFSPATLIRVNEDYFSIRSEKLYMHIPMRCILNIAESKAWVKADSSSRLEFNLLVTVLHNTETPQGYIGVSIPI